MLDHLKIIHKLIVIMQVSIPIEVTVDGTITDANFVLANILVPRTVSPLLNTTALRLEHFMKNFSPIYFIIIILFKIKLNDLVIIIIINQSLKHSMAHLPFLYLRYWNIHYYTVSLCSKEWTHQQDQIYI